MSPFTPVSPGRTVNVHGPMINIPGRMINVRYDPLPIDCWGTFCVYTPFHPVRGLYEILLYHVISDNLMSVWCVQAPKSESLDKGLGKGKIPYLIRVSSPYCAVSVHPPCSKGVCNPRVSKNSGNFGQRCSWRTCLQGYKPWLSISSERLHCAIGDIGPLTSNPSVCPPL